MADGRVTIDTRLDSTGLTSGLKNVGQRIKAPLGKIATLIAGAFATAKLVSFGKEAVQLASDIEEVQNVVDTAFGSMSYKMEKFAETSIETYGISKLTSKQMASTYVSMARGMGQSLSLATDKSLEITGRLADVMSFYNKTQQEVNTIGRAIYSGETEPLKNIGVIMTEAQLQTFALSKGYKTLYKDMSAADKLFVRQEYFLEQTNLAAGDFAKTSESWANQTRILSERWKEFKATLGTVVIPSIKPLIKILNDAVAKLQVFANTIQKVFGAKNTDSSNAINNMTNSTQDLTEATEEQIKAQQKMLGAYDDLQVISDDTGADTSVDISGLENIESITSSLDAVDEVVSETSTKIEEFLNLFKTGDYESIGKTIGSKIKYQLENIDWDSIYESAESFGTDFADFLNGVMDEDTFSSISETIGKLLNSSIYNSVSFLKRFNFRKFGSSVAKIINKFFQTFDFATLAQGINAFLTGVIDAIAGFLQTISFKSIISAIGDILKNLDWGTVIQVMSTIIAVKWIGGAILAGASGIRNALSTGLSQVLSSGLTGASVGIAAGLAVPLVLGIGSAIKQAQEEADYWANYRQWLVDSSMPTEEWQARIDELAGVTKNLVEESNNRISQLGNIQVDYQAIRNMSDRYFELAQKQNKSNEELAEMRGLHDTLISEFPEFKSILDSEDQSYKNQKSAITNLIGEMERKAKMRAAEELLVKAYKDQITAQQNLEKATTDYNEALSHLDGAQSEYQRTRAAYKEQLARIKDGHFEEIGALVKLKKEMETAQANYSRTSANILASRTAMREAQSAYDAVGKEIQRYSGIYRSEISTTVNSVDNSASKFTTFGKNILQGLKNGLSDSSAWAGVRNAISNVGNGVKNIFTKMFGIASPSKLFTQYGAFIDEGLALGLDKGSQGVKNSISEIGNIVSSLGIPNFSSGTLIPANSTFSSIVTTGLDTNTNQLLSGLATQLSSMNDRDIVVQIDGKNVFTAVRNQNNAYKKMTGATAF